MGIIADGWDSYRSEVVPPDALPVQVQETRRAFYAGARHLLSGILLMADARQDEEQFMEAIEGELQDFALAVTTGRA